MGLNSLNEASLPQSAIKVLVERTNSGSEASSPSDGFVFSSPSDRDQIKMQRQAIWDLLKHLGSQILSQGVNLTQICLPVKVFEPRSFLERITDNWGYLDLLDAAASAHTPADRLKLLAGFVIGGLRRQTSTLKPFNPILGETYQAEFPSGARVYAEQISHHPPISSWEVVDEDGQWRFTGNANWQASARGNSIRGQQAGQNAVWFAKDGATVTWELPLLLLKGILWGDRVLKYTGSVSFMDAHNGLRLDVATDAQAVGMLASLWRRKKDKALPDQIKGDLCQGASVLDTVSGSWLHHVDWQKGVNNGKVKRVWEAGHTPVRTPISSESPLPSDCRFREDLQALQAGQMEDAQGWKHTLEEQQRHDCSLRKEGLKSILLK